MLPAPKQQLIVPMAGILWCVGAPQPKFKQLPRMALQGMVGHVKRFNTNQLPRGQGWNREDGATDEGKVAANSVTPLPNEDRWWAPLSLRMRESREFCLDSVVWPASFHRLALSHRV